MIFNIWSLMMLWYLVAFYAIHKEKNAEISVISIVFTILWAIMITYLYFKGN